MLANPRVDQILPTFGQYDAIGIEAVNIRDLLRARGLRSDIFAEEGDARAGCRHISEYAQYGLKGNLLIHHFSIGSLVPYYLMGLACTIITRYHNITPEKYFPYEHNSLSRFKCKQGRQQFPLVNDYSDYYWADSRYNADELDQYHFRNGSVLPLMNNYDNLLEIKPCTQVSDFLKKDKRKILLFVGRVAPNKAHHDLIFLLKQCQDYIDGNVRLICVGKMDHYYGRTLLNNLASELGLRVGMYKPYSYQSDVVFTGPVTIQELVSFYRNADAFVCLSDHEGFCVPLVEAMQFSLPILAHKAAAVPETLADGGLLVDKNDPVETLNGLGNLLEHSKGASSKWRTLSVQRAGKFSWNNLTSRFNRLVDSVLI